MIATSARFAATSLALVLAASCDPGAQFGNGVLFVPHSTHEAVAPNALIKVSDRWLVFQADEATSGADGAGANFNAANGDSDTSDPIAVLVDMNTKKETVLGVACSEIAIVENEIYFAVDEAADHFDWNGDGSIGGFVLAHYPKIANGNSSPAAPDVEFVDDLEPSGAQHLAVVDGRLYYTRPDSAVTTLGESSLAWIDPLEPTIATDVLDVDATIAHHPRILRVDEELFCLYEDELVAGVDLNGDGDANDGFVLALLDATDPANEIRSVGLALRDANSPIRAKNVRPNDWLIGFLVNEAAQANFPNGLNDLAHLAGFDASSFPENCPAYDDTDTLDDVLHFLEFKNWNLDPIANSPVNTGIPGRERVLCTDNAVATIADEGDESSGTGGCDLNHDGDVTDRILRWTRILDPKHPYPFAQSLVAVADDTPGGACGVTDVADKLIAIVDEAKDGRDHDGNVANNRLITWADPTVVTNTNLWTYDQSSSATLFFGVTWLGDNTPRDFPRLAFQESVLAQNAGKAADTVLGNGDGDTKDMLPALAFFGSPTDFNFVWPRVAVKGDNAGMSFFNTITFFRVDEKSDNKDWDGNGDKSGCVLMGMNFIPLGTLNDLPRPAVEGGGKKGVAWIVDEAMAKQDVDHNGVANGFVVRWCRIGM